MGMSTGPVPAVPVAFEPLLRAAARCRFTAPSTSAYSFHSAVLLLLLVQLFLLFLLPRASSASSSLSVCRFRFPRPSTGGAVGAGGREWEGEEGGVSSIRIDESGAGAAGAGGGGGLDTDAGTALWIALDIPANSGIRDHRGGALPPVLRRFASSLCSITSSSSAALSSIHFIEAL